MKPAILILLAALCVSQASARTWHILNDGSGDAPTVQAGIDSSVAGDTVLVLPGRYLENIDFKGKAVVVSGSGPEMTIIDGSNKDATCVWFRMGETRSSVLMNFTITGGKGLRWNEGQNGSGGGISIDDCEPTIRNNVIIGNQSVYLDGPRESGFGGGIWCAGRFRGREPSPLLEENVIAHNVAGSNGGGIAITGWVSPRIVGNAIHENETMFGDGAGIWLRINGNSSPIQISGNRIEANRAADHGGGIYYGLVGQEPGEIEITQNIIAGNWAVLSSGVDRPGGGIWLWGGRPQIQHNTITSNTGEAIAIIRGSPEIRKNILSYSRFSGGIWCEVSATPIITLNLDWANAPALGSCADWWSLDENLQADPLFCNLDAGDFSLATNSPALQHPGGPLGALGVPGCSSVDVRQTTWGQIKTKYRN